MMTLAVNINFSINPEDLHVYRNMIYIENTTPAGVGQPETVHFYKHSMPQASENHGLLHEYAKNGTLYLLRKTIQK